MAQCLVGWCKILMINPSASLRNYFTELISLIFVKSDHGRMATSEFSITPMNFYVPVYY